MPTMIEILARIEEMRKEQGIDDAYDRRRWSKEIKEYEKRHDGRAVMEEIHISEVERAI